MGFYLTPNILTPQIWESMLIKPLTVMIESTTIAYALKFNIQDFKAKYRSSNCVHFYLPSFMPNL